jgi:mono/diheme cytochrome c family protein
MRILRAYLLLPSFWGAALVLWACAAAPEAAEPAKAAASAAGTNARTGEAVYQEHCLTCHQADGGGVPNLQPALLDSAWVKGEPQPLAAFVLTGGFNSASRTGGANHNVMPAFPQIPDAELAALLTYVRWNFGDKTGPVSVADVAAARKSLPPSP